MKLSLSVLKDWLGEKHSVVIGKDLSDELVLERPLLGCSGHIPQNGRLYVVDQSEYPANLGKAYFVALGIEQPNAKTLSVLDDLSLAELFNEIQGIYDLFDKWETALMRALHEEVSLSAAMDASRDIFKNPLSFMNSDFRILHISGEESMYTVAPPIDEQGYLPVEVVDTFKLDPYYNEVKEVRGPFLFPDDILPWNTLCVNFFYNEEFSARLVVSEAERKIWPSDTALLGHLHTYVERIYEQLLSSEADVGRTETILKSLLDGTSKNSNTLIRELASEGWMREGSYLCVRLKLSDKDLHNMTINFTCKQIQNAYVGSCVFEHEGGIIVLMNLNRYDKDVESFLSQLAIFIREGYFMAGCSMVFTDLLAFPDFYVQALAALELGNQLDKTNWFHHFNDYAVEYLLSRGSTEMSGAALSHRGLHALKSIDAQSKTNYYQTLYNYLLNNKNSTATAKSLFIHRLTLNYRLDRIKELTNIRWETAKECFYLLASYYLLENDADEPKRLRS